MLFSVVIPVFNSEKTVAATVDKTISFFNKNNYNFEIILINDGSLDDSWNILKSISEKYSNVISINLFKNVGQHFAIYEGFKFCKGDFVITIDDDLQNDPQELKNLIDKSAENYDVIFGKFKKKNHGFVRSLGSIFVNFLINKIFLKSKKIKVSNVKLISKKVIQRIINHNPQEPYINGLVLLFSKSVANVEINHDKRKIGKSNYNFYKIKKLLFTILFNYSSYPYKLISKVGFSLSIILFFFSIHLVVGKLFNDNIIPGWTSLSVIITLLFSIVFLILIVLGEYIIRILRQLSNSQNTFIDEVIDNRKIDPNEKSNF